MQTSPLAELIRSQRPYHFSAYLCDARRTLSTRLAIIPHLASFVRLTSDAMCCCVRQEPILKVDADINRILAYSSGMYDAYQADLRELATVLDWDPSALSRVVRASFEADTHRPLRRSGSSLVGLALDKRRHHEALYLLAAVALCEDQWHSAVERELEGQSIDAMYFGRAELSGLVAVDQVLDFSDEERQEGLALADRVIALYRRAIETSASLGDYITG